MTKLQTVLILLVPLTLMYALTLRTYMNRKRKEYELRQKEADAKAHLEQHYQTWLREGGWILKDGPLPTMIKRGKK